MEIAGRNRPIATQEQRNGRAYLCIGVFLLAIYLFWYIGVWPGPLGQDGYSLIANINQGAAKYTGKDAGWLLYALATYGISHRIEILVLPLLALHVAIFTRMTGWLYVRKFHTVAVGLIIAIACAPHILNYSTSLYPDSIFSLAFVALLFELWVALNEGKIDRWSILAIFALTPIALYFKANGLVIVLPFLYTIWKLKGTFRWTLVAILLFWTVVIQFGGKAADLGKGHGALKPLILYETVNFMQSRPMGLWENRHMVTDATKEVIYRYISQENIDLLYDRDYWDTLWHQNHDKVKFRQISKEDMRTVRMEFFKYNLWRNLPAFISSRVNIFFASALAQGGMVGPDNAKHTLNNVTTLSKYNPLGFANYPEYVGKIYSWSYDWRFFLWTPFVGIFLLFLALRKSISNRELSNVVITLALGAQLLGIMLFSIAAEYRYLLVFFYAPLLLVPILTQPPTKIFNAKTEKAQ